MIIKNIFKLMSFIIIINILFYLTNAYAESFLFYDSITNKPIINNFSFNKLINDKINTPLKYQNTYFFSNPITFEKNPVIKYNFQSNFYEIDVSKTSKDVLALFNLSASNNFKKINSNSLNIVYLKPKINNDYSINNNSNNKNKVLPINQKIESSVTSGNVNGYINNSSDPFGGENIIVNVVNKNNIVVGSKVISTNSNSQIQPFSMNVPIILPNSNDYYKVQVIAQNSTQTNFPTFKVYSANTTIHTQPIIMQPYYGKVYVTLYHKVPTGTETESELLTLAQNATITVLNTSAFARFIGESPKRFYRYVIDEAPAGQRTLQIMFPAHNVSQNTKINVFPNASISVLYTLNEN